MCVVKFAVTCYSWNNGFDAHIAGRDDFCEMFMQEVSELRNEIAVIKATLARMQAAG